VIVLTNPVSSGTALADAFDEAGVDCVHLYDRELADSIQDGRWSGHTLVHRDLNETACLLVRLGATAVVAASEYGVTLADELAGLLDLPRNEPSASRARRDKYLMARTVAAAGLPVAWSSLVRSCDELREVLAGRAFPVMIKPRSSAGSDGCRVCHTPEQAAQAFGEIYDGMNLLCEVNSEILVQEYLDGPQFIVNTVSLAGRHVLADFYRCRIDNTDAGAPVYRHIRSPLRLDDRDREIIAYALSCLDALGVVDGAAHTELRYTRSGPRLVEVNSRVMGPCLAPDPYFAALGITHQHLVVERYTNPARFAKRVGSPYAPSRALAKVFLRPSQDGVLRAIPGVDVLRKLPGFHSIARLPRIGEPVPDRLLTTGASGIAFLVHDDEARLFRSLAIVHELEDSGRFFEVAA
jgi:glutathione synthase/RimK-type ligase-like ATP-grasp enzyme